VKPGDIRTKDDLPSDTQALKDLLWSLLGEYRRLEDKCRLFEKQLFGRSSEKRPQAPQDPECEQMQLSELVVQAAQVPQPDADHSFVTVPAHQRRRQNHPGRNVIPESIPVQEHVVDISEEQKNCTHCPSRSSCRYQKLVALPEVKHDVVEREPASYTCHRYITRRYACPAKKEAIQAAEPPTVSPIAKSIAGLNLLVFVVLSKYLYHLPLYRIQRQIFHESGGIWFTRSTMVCWIRELCVPLERVYRAMIVELKRSRCIHADDSFLRRIMLQGGSRSAYMWVYLDYQGRVSIFDYRESRGADAPRTFLTGCSPGTYLMTDGSPAFNDAISRHRLIGMQCLVHCRRYFVEALDRGLGIAYIRRILRRIARIYRLEQFADDHAYTREQRTHLRKRLSAAILNSIKAHLDNPDLLITPASALAKAVNYMLNQWAKLERFLDDGELPLDNNADERIIRALAVGRNNWMFVVSEEGGKRMAILLSIITCCKLNGIDPEQYFRDVLMRLAVRAPAQSVTDLTPLEWLKARNGGALPPPKTIYPSPR
jgi:transposase